jgi:HEAT repeat protein
MTSADSDKLGPKVRQAIEAEIQQVGRQLLIALGKCGGQWASIALSIEHPLFSKNDLAVALGELGTSEAFSLLRKLIEDNDFESGLNPYIALRSFDAEDSAQVLLKVLKNMEGKSADDIQWIVSHIVDYSRTVCDKSLVPVLEKAYAMYSKAQPGELDTYIHVEMAQQLYFIDSTASRAALERLSRVGGPACVPPLLMLARDGLRDTSNALIAALKDIEDDQKWVECLELVGAELNPMLLPVVEFALKCSEEQYCEVWEHFLDCVFESVIEMPPDKTKDFMLRCLKEEFPPEVRQTFAKVLALRFKSPETKAVLAGMYAEDKALNAAFLLLRSYGDTRGVDTLKAALDKGKVEVHLWGEQNSYLFPSGLNDWIETQPLLDLPPEHGKELWRYAVERFIEVANKAAQNRAEGEEIQAACAAVAQASEFIGRNRVTELLPIMKTAWRQFKSSKRITEEGTGAEIAAALHMLGDKAGLEYLVSIAKQEYEEMFGPVIVFDDSIGHGSAYWLAELHDPNSIPLLEKRIEALPADSKVAQSLNRLIDKIRILLLDDPLPSIRKILKTRELPLAGWAVWKLGELGSPDDIPLLKDVAESGDFLYWIGITAKEAIGKVRRRHNLPKSNR